jgi:hypothetical protein
MLFARANKEAMQRKPASRKAINFRRASCQEEIRSERNAGQLALEGDVVMMHKILSPPKSGPFIFVVWCAASCDCVGAESILRNWRIAAIFVCHDLFGGYADGVFLRSFRGVFCETIPLRTMMPFRMMPFRRLSLFALLLAAGLLTAVPATQAQPSSSASDVAEAPPTSDERGIGAAVDQR